MAIDEVALRRAFAAMQARIAYLEKASGLFVDDAKLDDPKGDITVHFNPNNWRGAGYKGSHASACSPEFLEAYAEALQYMADHPKPGDDPKRPGFNRLDAARARSWARRLRARPVAPTSEPAKDGAAPAPKTGGGGGRPSAGRPGTGRRPGARRPGAAAPPVDPLGADEDPLGLADNEEPAPTRTTTH